MMMSSKPKISWKNVFPFMSDKDKERDKIIIKEGDNVIANSKDVCNVFNEYCINTANDMSEPDHIDIEGALDDILSAYQNHHGINEIKRRRTVDDDVQFEFHLVTQVDIFKKLSSLNNRKACRYHEQPPHLLKLGAPILSFTLLPISNNVIEQNVFPTDLKYEKVTPLLKKDDKMNKEKYSQLVSLYVSLNCSGVKWLISV